MSAKNYTQQMAEYAASDHSESLDEKDLKAAKLFFVDWIGAAMTGVSEKESGLIMKMNDFEGVRGDSAVIGRGRRTSTLEAALINGVESHAIDYDDIHDFYSLHLCSPLYPAAFAAAEYAGASGMELLNGIAVGAQVMVAISAAIMPEHYNNALWHAMSSVGIFGAGAAAAAILKLAPEQTCSAFGLCAGLCSGIQLNFGTMGKPLAAGMAAKNGLMAAMLAKDGFTGRDDIFDTPYLDMMAGRKAEPDKMIERLYDKKQGVREIRLKRYSSCVATHSGMINCRKILRSHPHALSEIERITFKTYPRAMRLVGNLEPRTAYEGKFSIAFTAAAQIVFGKVTVETFSDENVHNPEVRVLMKRMELIPDDEFTWSRGGRTTIHFTDGTAASNTTYLLGHDADPDDFAADLTEKFNEVMIPRVGAKKTKTVYDAVMSLEKLSCARELSPLL